MKNIPELFGSMVFNDDVMKERLSKDVYKSLHKTIGERGELDITVANAVAVAMKDWAIEKGATHYTHWFQPMTGITAEKHDSFISPQDDGRVIMEFSGKELIKGEPDASSFPSGGLRATFEARGYTAWDPTSYAFIKDDSLCIPTVFCSYSGEVLDKKTPLLRSMELISKQAKRVLKALGDDTVKSVTGTVGPEQEYFLIDKEMFKKRKDLIFTGRTLFGAKSPKGQELEDHYFGVIKPRVMAFMKDLNEELWKLGIYAKTEHNEVAPAQHELAPIFTNINTATDHNQLTMEVMKRVADRHGLACLLHEKPFAGVNGSGKHVNWSLSTDTGRNLFDSGKKPEENKQFLLFMSAVIKAIDEHQDLLRISAASAGNDCRLGANEAPPAIVSIFLGSELTAIFDSIASGNAYSPVAVSKMKMGVETVPQFRKDSTDRNRTSPFAFTGNKFEFRMLGSAFSISGPNIVLNTVVADVLDGFASRLEKAKDVSAEADAIIKDVITKHKRILFDGNNYSDEWVKEAEKRGLLNLRTSADAIPLFESDKNIKLFTKHNIFSEAEMRSRCEILLETYEKINMIDALTMLDIVKKEIFPAAQCYEKDLLSELSLKKSLGLSIEKDSVQKTVIELSKSSDALYSGAEVLEKSVKEIEALEGAKAKANYVRDILAPAMAALRASADKLETLVSKELWPFPTYGDMLFSV